MLVNITAVIHTVIIDRGSVDAVLLLTVFPFVHRKLLTKVRNNLWCMWMRALVNKYREYAFLCAISINSW